jgi:hypothetical protein
LHGTSGVRGEAGKIGAGAGVGAIIGGILGGVKGALAGILIGGGGTVAATTGKDVELQPGTVLRMRFDAPLVVRQGPGTRDQGLGIGDRGSGADFPYSLLATSFIAPFAAAIVFSTSRSVCAPERNHASNCDGGG